MLLPVISRAAHNRAGKGTGELRAAALALARPSHGCIPGDPQQAGGDQGGASPPPRACGKPRRGVKSPKRRQAAGKPALLNPRPCAFHSSFYFPFTASQSTGCLTGLVFSHPVSPPRRFGDKRRLTTCKKPHALSPHTPSPRPSEGRGKPQPYRHALPSGTFPPAAKRRAWLPPHDAVCLFSGSLAERSRAPAMTGRSRGCWPLPPEMPAGLGEQGPRCGAPLYPLKP